MDVVRFSSCAINRLGSFFKAYTLQLDGVVHDLLKRLLGLRAIMLHLIQGPAHQIMLSTWKANICTCGASAASSMRHTFCRLMESFLISWSPCWVYEQSCCISFKALHTK